MGLISAPRQCTLRMHIRWACFCNQLGQTHIRGRRPEGTCFYGFARSVLLIVLTTWIEKSYSESSYEKPNPSRYDKGVRFADGVSLTQEEHYSVGRLSVSKFFFYHSCAAPVVYCSTSRSSKGEQENAPHGVREVRAPHVLGARTLVEFLWIIVRLDSSKGHLVLNRKAGPGWSSYSRMGAFFPKIST